LANLIAHAGVDRVVLMDLHASQIQGFFDCPSDHLYSSKVFYEDLKRLGIKDGVAVSPDVGSAKLVRAFAKSLNMSLGIVDKRRPKPNQAEVMNIVGDVDGKDVIIRDDMVDTAGTLTEAALALKEKGAKRIIAVCTHAVFSGEALKRIEDSPIEKLFISDSVFHNVEDLISKIEVLSVSEIFAEAIIRIHEERSLTSLFE